MSKISDFWYDLKWGLWNFWFFRREIWRYRNYDYIYNLELFRRSLIPLRDRLKNGITESGPQDAKDIQRFLDATENIEFFDVCEELDDLIKRSWESWEFSAGETITNNTQTLTKEEQKRKKQLLHRARDWEEKRWNRAVKEFSKLRGWWD